MIKILFFFSFFVFLLSNEKKSNDTLVFPKLDLRDGTYIFNSNIDLTDFFEKERKHHYLTDEQIEKIKKNAKEMQFFFIHRRE